MADSKSYNTSDQGHYQQFDNPHNQYSNNQQKYPQQRSQSAYQQIPQHQQTDNQSYRSLSHHFNQEGRAYQPSAQNGYYNSNPTFAQLTHSISVSGDPALGTKEQYMGVYKFLWIVFLWEAFGLGWWSVSLVIIRKNIIFNLYLILAIIQTIVLLVATLTAEKLTKGFQENDANIFLQGKKVFTLLEGYQIIYFIIWLIGLFSHTYYFSFEYTFFVIIPMAAFPIVISKCDQLHKFFGRFSNTYVSASM